MTNEASFEKHRAHIPCYALRHLLGLRNSSNRVEKANDLVVAQRQKHNGMSWSITGSIALAQIKALFLNHEMSRWLHSRTLPLFLPAASMDYSNRSGRNILKILFIMKEYCLFMGNMHQFPSFLAKRSESPLKKQYNESDEQSRLQRDDSHENIIHEEWHDWQALGTHFSYIFRRSTTNAKTPVRFDVIGAGPEWISVGEILL